MLNHKWVFKQINRCGIGMLCLQIPLLTGGFKNPGLPKRPLVTIIREPI